jgi:cytoskeletal protein CcmA (bactofilin family)
MARKAHEDALGVAGAETVIGTGVIVHGNLESESDIAIDGTLDGSVKTKGNVIVGVNANIKANIHATSIIIAGTVKGNVTSEGETSILETGHLVGDVDASGLAITSGGIFVGRSLVSSPQRVELGEAPEPAPIETDSSVKDRKSSRDHES